MNFLERARFTFNILIGVFVASLVVAEGLGMVTFTPRMMVVAALGGMQCVLFALALLVRYNGARQGRARPRRPGLGLVAEVSSLCFTITFGLSILAVDGSVADVPEVAKARKLLFGVAALVPVAVMAMVVYGFNDGSPPTSKDEPLTPP